MTISITPDLSDKITRLHRSAQNARNAANAAQKQAAQTYLIKRAGELSDERDRLYAVLNKQTDWLDTHRDDPRHDAFLDQWFQTERDYRAVVDALKSALDTWLEPREREAA